MGNRRRARIRRSYRSGLAVRTRLMGGSDVARKMRRILLRAYRFGLGKEFAPLPLIVGEYGTGCTGDHKEPTARPGVAALTLPTFGGRGNLSWVGRQTVSVLRCIPAASELSKRAIGPKAFWGEGHARSDACLSPTAA
ncbi:protein of unknown function [Candidatus Hydrogenisulfobacillus filiaventi]|uniref:Uncharacterized protein n=1 Tax=Candidatus Hydrogenisulfobacillus filiaventi TaxID=2707344 RepID=A0A6F8ZFL8_9FIRM|nr:protein of unknown function [Candidatus Hydrogenisulfobacillus filiaventi]